MPLVVWPGLGGLAARGQDGGEGVECLRDDGVVGPFAALAAGKDPGVDQDLQVVGDGRLGEAEWLGELADAGLAVVVRGDHGDEAEPGGRGEGLEDVSEGGGLARG